MSRGDIYVHVRIIIGIIMGLSVGRLLTGVARFIQHPGQKVYPVHLGWVLFLFFTVVNFWWWEFQLSGFQEWNFAVYLFVIFYAMLFFLLCTLLFPDSMQEYAGFEDYFHSRRRWFFALLALIFVVDVADTALKGSAHFNAFGIEYPIRAAIYFALAIAAIFVRAEWYHRLFVAFALVYQVVWGFREYFSP
jgi:hypothetical protein